MGGKIFKGVMLGAIAGFIDVIPMVAQKLSWDANISAFLFWMVSGFFIATSNLKLSAPAKGAIISFLALLPALILIIWQDPAVLPPIFVMTLMIGSTLGFLIEKIS